MLCSVINFSIFNFTFVPLFPLSYSDQLLYVLNNNKQHNLHVGIR